MVYALMSRSIITISFLQTVFCLAFFTVLSPGIDDIHFEYIPIREGSANETVTGIVQDSQGFMWFGTRYGLFKYDGKRFTAYRHNPGDNNSLANDVILHLLYDHLGHIWIATAKGGMDRLDTSNNRFSHFTFPAVKKEQEKDNTVENIIIDHDKTLWTSTTSGNLYTFDQSTNAFSRFLPADIEQDLYKEPHILNVFEDSTNNFWLSIEDAGPVILDLVKKTLSIAGFAEEQGFGPSLWGGAWLLEDNQQIMWARARGGGLLKYDLKTKKLSRARYSIIPAGIYVNCMVEDSFGHLWIGTADAGLYRYDPASGRIISFRHDPVNPHSLSSNRILSLFVDKSGTIWVGTQKGLNKYSYF
ncbi:MAG: hypothetical protein MI702_07620, partial [Chlorobiales bacterium]|nr:hypothetical protein [Chlorobiales bacterium]